MFTKQSNRVNSAVVVDAFGRRVRRLAAALACSALIAAAVAAAAEGRQLAGGRFNRAARIAELVHEALEHEGPAGGGAGCIELATMSVMFEPSATEADVRVYFESMGDDELAYYITHSMWTQTATDGAVAEGQSMTLTYSFVPDGTVIQSSTPGEPAGPSNLFATLDASFPGGRPAWKAAFAQVFADWSEVSNITYVEVSDDGAGFPLAPGQLGARGDVRIAMRPLGAGPLARNYYPSFGGDMVLDADDMATFGNAASGFRSLRNVLAHEHGHGLGLQHVLPQSGTKLMEPSLNTGFDGPQEDDIRGVQFLYGDWAEANDSVEQAEFLGGPLGEVAQGVQVMTAEDVALERDGAADFYGFTAFAGVPIAIRVEPVGTEYPFGPQPGGAPSTVDAAAARNLALRLWRRVSAQNNTFQLAAQIDFKAAGEAEYHPPILYTHGGYLVAEVYSTDGVDDVQRYSLTISNAAIEAPQLPPVLRAFVAGAGTELGADDTVFFDDTEIGDGSAKTILVLNDGDGELALGNITIAGPGAGDFSFNLVGSSTLAPGGQASLAVSFIPTAPGARLAVLKIPNNDPQRSDFGFIVRGLAEEAPAPAMQVFVEAVEIGTTDVIDFGSGELAAELALELSVRNSGTATLNVSSVEITGTHAAEFSCSIAAATLPPGASTTGTLIARPAAAGVREAQLRIVSNDPGGIRLFILRAEGIAPITDCNGNGIDDAEDIATGGSDDCDGNGMPDECQADGDDDGVIDPCDTHPLDPTDGAANDNDGGETDPTDTTDGEEADTPDDDTPVVEDEPGDDDEESPKEDEPAPDDADEDDDHPNGDGEDETQGDEEQEPETGEGDDAGQEGAQEDVDLRPAAGMCGAGAAPALLATLMSLGGLRLAGGRRRP